MDPRPFTLRKLLWMAKAKQTHDWDQISLLWATQVNVHRDSKQHPKPYCPSMVHPNRTHKDYKPKPKEIPIEELARMFGG